MIQTKMSFTDQTKRVDNLSTEDIMKMIVTKLSLQIYLPDQIIEVIHLTDSQGAEGSMSDNSNRV